MNVKPLADRVLVLPAQAEEKVGGIIIQDTATEKPQHGKVVATGNGTKDEEMVLKEGDEILYGKYSVQSLSSTAQSTSSCVRAMFSLLSTSNNEQTYPTN